MKICINSRDLTSSQRHGIEQYFHDNFAFGGKSPKLLWMEDDSEFMLLGFCESDPGNVKTIEKNAHKAPVVMFRVHENEMLKIAGREFMSLIHDCPGN